MFTLKETGKFVYDYHGQLEFREVTSIKWNCNMLSVMTKVGKKYCPLLYLVHEQKWMQPNKLAQDPDVWEELPGRVVSFEFTTSIVPAMPDPKVCQ